jgi:cyclic pyranopterin phosphate synthase
MTRRVLTPEFHGIRWLELVLDYRCNLRCLGCRACDGAGGSMKTHDALGWLAWGRRQSAAGLWLGGGEPTLRDDLLGLVRAAKKLGFRDVAVQTNASRLSYAHYADALVAAGVTHVRVNLKSADAALHDRLSGEDGTHARALSAIGLLRGRVELAADVLLTRETAPGVAQTVALAARSGVKEVALWLFSAADGGPLDEIPRITDLLPALGQAVEVARAEGIDLASFHTPPCTLPADLRGVFRPAASLGLVVVDPGGRPFAVAESPVEGGAYVEGCEECPERERCPGPREDYRRAWGDAEFGRERLGAGELEQETGNRRPRSGCFVGPA